MPYNLGVGIGILRRLGIMICIGELTEVKTRLEDMIDTIFPDDLSAKEIVALATEYERLLNIR